MREQERQPPDARFDVLTESPALTHPAARFDRDRILAFAVGKPSEAFGEPYRVFDEERFIARLPGAAVPASSTASRASTPSPGSWRPAASIEAEYDVPPDAWYFAADRQDAMPFACCWKWRCSRAAGWRPTRLGPDQPRRPLFPQPRRQGGAAPPPSTASRHADHRRPPHRGVALGRHDYPTFDFDMRRRPRRRLPGQDLFRLLLAAALAQQVGIRGAALYEMTPAEQALRPEFRLSHRRPVSRSTAAHDRPHRALTSPTAGRTGWASSQGSKTVDPSEWFFKAHFYQDPVCPGSLGLESLLQLLKVVAVERWGGGPHTRFRSMTGAGRTTGSTAARSFPRITKSSSRRRDRPRRRDRRLTADGLLWVDGQVIYQMNDFTLSMVDEGP